MNDVIIKKSKINGNGVFVNRDFFKGEVVVYWRPKLIKKSDIDNLPKKERHYVKKIGQRFYLMQLPERLVNHSCEPNTKTNNKCDIAIRNIKRGEEVTSNYLGQGLESFQCRCKSKKCKKLIK